MIEVVGVLGGTFDPVHVAHLELAEAVRAALGLRRVLLVPCAVPPHKDQAMPTAASHRLEMIRLAIADRPGLEVSTIELDRGGTSFTIETLRALRLGPPPCLPVFVLGTDSLTEIESWRDYRSILEEFDLAAVRRPGAPAGAVRARLGAEVVDRIRMIPAGAGPRGLLPEIEVGRGGRVFLVEISPADISSSRIRALAKRGESLDGLVPAQVARYIRANDLYGTEDGR